jgi:exodeoxyribonuclease X
VTQLKFGKYRGQALEQIARQDPGYLNWMLGNLKDLSADMRYSINHFLKLPRED